MTRFGLQQPQTVEGRRILALERDRGTLGVGGLGDVAGSASGNREIVKQVGVTNARYSFLVDR